MASATTVLYVLCVYVPDTHAEALKEALFAAGAGRLGRYDRCCWQSPGQGQFRPLPGSRAFVGKVGETETVAETRIEVVCEEAVLNTVLAALRAAHPYETPAYHYWRVNDATHEPG
ncbi:MAG: NGG1p interacting factor NIF3 [Lentisphaeria bacterium]|nr:NGG1p interacting factor NIF3 [Lentisphaeria bacterium]